MKVEISFVVGTSPEADHRTDSRFSKVFDVDWPGRPMPGETIETDIPHPITEESFQVAGIYWTTQSPTWITLERVVLQEADLDWDGGLPAYGRHVKSYGWEVFGPAGRETAS